MNSPQKLPAVLEGLRATMQTRLDASLKNMLNRLEEIIFQWCQGLSDAEQQRYMDIIIDVRRNRAQIEMDISRSIANSFLQLPSLKMTESGKKNRRSRQVRFRFAVAGRQRRYGSDHHHRQHGRTHASGLLQSV